MSESVIRFGVKLTTADSLNMTEALEIVQGLLGRLDGSIELEGGRLVVLQAEISPEPVLDTDPVDPTEAFKAGAEEARRDKLMGKGLLSPKQFPSG